jgi:outer membrane protein OmpA-like peptidoglycan-associated protein
VYVVLCLFCLGIMPLIACAPANTGESGALQDADRRRLEELEAKVNHQTSTWSQDMDEVQGRLETLEGGEGLAVALPRAYAYDTVMNAEVFFDKEEYVLDSRDLQSIDGMAATLAKEPHTILEIRGHADRSGPRWYNFLLSEQRAQAVCRYLVDKYYIPLHRLDVVGFGFDYPKDSRSKSKEQGEFPSDKDRRVEMLLLRPKFMSDAESVR